MSLQDQIQGILDAMTSKETGPAGLAFVAVDRDGKELVSATSGKKDAESKEKLETSDVFWIASCTKVITGIALLQLVEQGKISLDESVEEHLPELKNRPILPKGSKDDKEVSLDKLSLKDGEDKKERKKITLRMLLSHTSGFGYSFFSEELLAWTKEKGYDEFSGGPEGYRNAPLIASPGTEWNYSTGLDWAGILLHKLTGKTLGEYMEDHIFKPLGMQATFDLSKKPEMKKRVLSLNKRSAEGKVVKRSDDELFGNYTKPSFDAGGGGLFTTPTDYVKLLTILINKGKGANGAQILKPETVELAFEDQLKDLPEGQLARPLNTTRPDLANPGPDGMTKWSPEDKHSWGLSFCLCQSDIMTGRKAPSAWWAGLPNLFWWADPTTGVAGTIFSQTLPFGDVDVFTAWVQCEATVYGSLKSKSE